MAPRGTCETLHLRLKSPDIQTYKKIFEDLEYDLEIARTPRTIIDAGANVGFASVFFARKYPSARIIAIEPEPANFAILAKNVAAFPNVTPVQAALWREDGELELVDPGIGNWGFQAQDSHSVSSHKVVNKVEGMTLDRLMAIYALEHLDILKIDIEGGEKEVFEDAGRWIDKVGVIMAELHDGTKEGCGRSFYQATSAFTHREVKGENVFVLRESYVVPGAEPQTAGR